MAITDLVIDQKASNMLMRVSVNLLRGSQGWEASFRSFLFMCVRDGLSVRGHFSIKKRFFRRASLAYIISRNMGEEQKQIESEPALAGLDRACTGMILSSGLPQLNTMQGLSRGQRRKAKAKGKSERQKRKANAGMDEKAKPLDRGSTSCRDDGRHEPALERLYPVMGRMKGWTEPALE